MAVSTTDTFSGPYIANGVTVAFPFTFKAVSADDVAVLRRPADGADVIFSTSEYTVALGNSGGTVTFFIAPADGDIYVVSEPSFMQAVEFASGQPFQPAVVNEVNDRDVARALYLKAMADRSFTAPVGEVAGTIPPLSQRGGKLALFGFDGNMLAVDTLGVGNPDFRDDGLWNAADAPIDDGGWG